ncbi:MAG: hypothetical protein K8I29_10255, partial [Alphaproteobacteria bacterium]|nr:hypothetical protein [Candidatus Nitrobium versatile]
SIGIAEQSIMNSNIKRGSYETSKERLRSWGIPLPCRRPLSQEFLRSEAKQSQGDTHCPGILMRLP